MRFVRQTCTPEIFEQLALPAHLRDDEKRSPIGGPLVFDADSRSALVPHPFHYADYPDRHIDFYVEGRCYSAMELIERSDGPDRVEIYFKASVGPVERASIVSLFQQAVAVFRNEPVGALPVVERSAS